MDGYFVSRFDSFVKWGMDKLNEMDYNGGELMFDFV